MTPWQRSEIKKRTGQTPSGLFPFQSSRGIDYGGMEGDLIGLFLLVGLELLVTFSSSPGYESKRNYPNHGQEMARIVMVVAGIELTWRFVILEGLGPACGRVVLISPPSMRHKCKQFFSASKITILDIVFSDHHCRRATENVHHPILIIMCQTDRRLHTRQAKIS